MIDVTKPIRRIKSGEPVTVTEGHGNNYLVEDSAGDYVGVYSQEALERLYENVPEPRRPREWLVSSTASPRIYDAVPVGNNHAPMCSNVRVIEWPADAPLPEWPA